MALAFVERFRLHTEPGSFASVSGGLASNKDLDPVPFESEERKWTWPSLLGFWIAEAFSISMYQVASSSITKGLSPGLAIVAVLVGHLLVCIPATLNGYVGSIYGINFPVLMRSTFGIYGAYFAVFIRGVVACICKFYARPSIFQPSLTRSQGSELRAFKGDNASRLCCKQSGHLSRPSQITFQPAHMSLQPRCFASSSSLSFSYLYFGFMSLS
jgi:hypothetical protein